MSEPLHDLSCAIHIHSTCSDGTATVPEIVAAARQCGRDVVVLTDHDTMRARELGHEGWHDSVLLLVGEEISPKGGHYLALGLEEELEAAGLTEREIPAAVTAAGGFGFAAHPFSHGSRMASAIAPPHPWPHLDDPAIAGLELWSLQTEVAERWASPREAWRSLLVPERELDGPPDANLRAWDAICAQRCMVGIAGLDAHQKGVRLLGRPLSPMPHRRWLGLLSTHVLCRRPPRGELEPDRAEVYGALREGRCYVSRDSLADPRGFEFRAEDGARALAMGERALPGEWTLRAALPREAWTVLRRDGEAVAATEGDRFEWTAGEPGAYRVEAALGPEGERRRWIVSNPIYLRR